MLGVSNEADHELRSGDVGKSDGTSESLILLGVVVLESDLELNGLDELSLLLLVLEDSLEAFSDLGLGKVLSQHIDPLY